MKRAGPFELVECALRRLELEEPDSVVGRCGQRPTAESRMLSLARLSRDTLACRALRVQAWLDTLLAPLEQRFMHMALD